MVLDTSVTIESFSDFSSFVCFITFFVESQANCLVLCLCPPERSYKVNNMISKLFLKTNRLMPVYQMDVISLVTFFLSISHVFLMKKCYFDRHFKWSSRETVRKMKLPRISLAVKNYLLNFLLNSRKNKNSWRFQTKTLDNTMFKIRIYWGVLYFFVEKTGWPTHTL